jgi:hypothetical protein
MQQMADTTADMHA